MKYLKLVLFFIINPFGFVFDKGKIVIDKKIHWAFYLSAFIGAFLFATLLAYVICDCI